MSAELEELLEFLHHGNTQIRQIACENLVAYSSNASIFKKSQLVPVQDLKLLVRDYLPIAKNAITILINLSSHDDEILLSLAQDDAFLDAVLKKLANPKDSPVNELTQLLANLSKHPSLSRLLTFKAPSLPTPPSSHHALDVLLDLFVRDANPTSTSNYDYLSYTLASLSGLHESVRKYFLTTQSYDSLTPLAKLLPFTEHPSHIRRAGVARSIKNVCFEISYHHILLSPEPEGVNLLPYILLPLAGPEEFPLDESENMPAELQLLPPNKARETDNEILVTHLETLLLLTSSKQGREVMRKVQVYALVRECHQMVEDEEVREACDRLVQVLMRDEVDDEAKEKGEDGNGEALVDEDETVEEIF